MKEKISFICTLLLWITLTASVHASPLTIGSGFQPPLSTSKQTGMLDLITKEAFSRIGMEVMIVHLPSERSIRNANEGIDDGDLVRIGGINRLYPNLIQVPEKSITFEFVAFTNQVDLKVSTWQDLYPFSIGVVRGWKILEENTRGVSVLTKVETPKLLFTLLKKNRADLVFYERLQGYGMMKELGLPNIQVFDPPLAVREMFLYLHKKHKPLVPQIAAALKEIKKDGTYSRIVRQTMSVIIHQEQLWPKP